jgi:isopentenyl phosphate kinase
MRVNARDLRMKIGANLIFLKLGGSAITDKNREATARPDIIQHIARQVKRARAANPGIELLIGHGSGSFGHFAAKKSGYGQPNNWRAFAETGAAAARLNRIVADIFLAEGVPVVSLQPSASARCRDGELIDLAVEPIRTALAHDLIPMVHGDVAFDETRDMSIASTEIVFAYLARVLKPSRIILAGIVDGVFTADPLRDASAELIREITPQTFSQIESQLRGSHGVDVTGGMIGKVRKMVELVGCEPAIRIQIVSAMREGTIERVLRQEDSSEGTLIHA